MPGKMDTLAQSGLPFMKMHGAGNDFVVIDSRGRGAVVTAGLARALGDRNRGVGFDQLAEITSAPDADFGLVFWNSDGSQAGACGNATRCVSDYVMQGLGADRVSLVTARGGLGARPVWHGSSGPTARPVLDLSARLPSVTAKGARLSDAALTVHSDGFDTATGSGPLSGSAVVASVTLDNPAAAPLVAGELRAAFTAALTPDVLSIQSGSLKTDAIDGSFDGSVTLADGALAFNLRSDILSAALPLIR